MTTRDSAYLYPLVYLGPKARKEFPPAGPVLKPVVFERGPEAAAFGDKPYAYVSEVEARYIMARSHGPAGPLFSFADGKAPSADNATLTARVAQLEEQVQQLLALLTPGADEAPPDDDAQDDAQPALKKGKK